MPVVAEHRAEKLRWLAARRDKSLARVKPEPPADKILLDPQPPSRQYGGVIVEQRKVINVADIRRPQHLGHEMIEPVEIKICEELTGQVPDRQAAAAAERVEQIVAVEIVVHRLLRV